MNECPYSAKRLYVDRWKNEGMPENSWPTSMLGTSPITEDKLWHAIKNGPYGRCVFYSDNDACDNQTVQMSFKNGVKAILSVTGFNSDASRKYIFHGTYGTVELTADAIIMREYGKEPVKYPTAELVRAGEAHGGGDLRLIDSLYGEISGQCVANTSLENSMEGYLIGIAAEESRALGGEAVKVHK